MCTGMRWRSVLFGLFFGGLGVACSSAGSTGEDPGDDQELSGEDLISSTFKQDAILEDVDMLDSDALTASEIDAFLRNPYPDLNTSPSCLASYRSGGKTAGQLIAERSKKYGLNPLFLLAHLQKESSLVGSTQATCSPSRMAAAFGCGCHDGEACAPQYAGFVNQLECAARLTREYMDDLDGSGATVSGWRLNTPKLTLDKRTIAPKTRATAVLYTYTPWVGNKTAAGNKAPFGNFLFWKVWLRYASTLGYKGVTLTPACTSDASCTGGQPGAGKVCSTTGATRGMCVAGCRDDGDCQGDKVCSHETAAGACVTPDGEFKALGETCGSNDECNGGHDGTERVCGSSSRVCIVGCGSDQDCPEGKSCDRTLPKWACVAD